MNRRDSVIPLCRRTKSDGRLCGSPAMTGSAFCYFHGGRRGRTRAAGLHPRYRSPLRDVDSIQRTLSAIIAGIASGDLRPTQAGRMIYAVQMALANLPGAAPQPMPRTPFNPLTQRLELASTKESVLQDISRLLAEI